MPNAFLIKPINARGRVANNGRSPPLSAVMEADGTLVCSGTDFRLSVRIPLDGQITKDHVHCRLFDGTEIECEGRMICDNEIRLDAVDQGLYSIFTL